MRAHVRGRVRLKPRLSLGFDVDVADTGLTPPASTNSSNVRITACILSVTLTHWQQFVYFMRLKTRVVC